MKVCRKLSHVEEGRNFIHLTEEQSASLFRIFAAALSELNWHGDFSAFWSAHTSLSSEQFSTVMRALTEGLLLCNEIAGKHVALLAKASGRGSKICMSILNQGGLPCLITAITAMLSPSMALLRRLEAMQSNGRAALDYLCCNGMALNLLWNFFIL